MIARFALREIKRRKARSTANILGYIIAVSFFIIMLSLAQAYNVVASGNLRGIGTHFVVYIPASAVCPCEEREVGPYFGGVYTPTFSSNIVEVIKNLEGVEDASGYLGFRLDNMTIAGLEVSSLATQTVAISPQIITQGRYLQETDTNKIILDEIYANLHFKGVGDELQAFDRTFGIVGITNPSTYSRPAGITNMYALLNEVQHIAKFYSGLYGFSVSEINAVLVEISPVGDAEYVEQIKKNALETLEFEVGGNGQIAGYQCDVEARKVVSLTENNAALTSIILFSAAILFSGIIQFSSIIERKQEIGLFKALGWRDSDVSKQILAESLILGTIGGLIGVIIGFTVMLLIPLTGLLTLQNLVFATPILLLAIGLLFSIVAGAIAGLIPAWNASKLQPSTALRHF